MNSSGFHEPNSPNMLVGDNVNRVTRGKRRSGILQPPASLIERLGYVRKDSIDSAPFSTHTQLNAKDRHFLTSVTRGDLPTVRRLLETANTARRRRNSIASCSDLNNVEDININCSDVLGRSALRIAIENENLEIVELLLRYENIDVGDALLHAIQNESIGSVVLLLNHASKRKDLMGIFGELPSTSFTQDITPIILASIKDNYAIIHLLLESGFSIPQPHDIRCSCEQCGYRGVSQNSLGMSRSRLNIYSALASPSLMCLTSRDPLLTAFELSSQMRALARLEVEFRGDYNRLAAQCRQFAVDLLDQVRDSTELSTILNYDPELRYFEERRRALLWKRNSASSIFEGSFSNGAPSLTRLKLAIKYRQKQFISHPSCQQFLSAIWYSAIPGFRQMSFIAKFSVLITIGLFSPFLCVANMFFPNSRVGRLISQPFIKFVCHAASYSFFLVLLLLASQRFDIGTFRVADRMSTTRGPSPTATEWLIVLFVAGNIWLDAKALWNLGVQDFLGDRWHLLTFAINHLFLCVISLRAVNICQRMDGSIDDSLPRRQWPNNDPNLVVECIFAIASVFACLKLISFFTVSPKIGPLQIAFGRMLIDIAKFGIVYSVLLLAFSCGLSQVYWFYANKPDCGEKCENSNRFASIFDIVQSLYWGLFSLIDLVQLDLMGEHRLTAFVGKLLFGSYTFMGVIVLVNALIAMMTDSYKKTQRHADIEWKFALAKLWLSYFESVYELPVPFNLLPSVAGVQDVWRAISDLCRFISTIRQEKNRRNSTENVFPERGEDFFVEEIILHAQERTFRYQQIIRELAKRYLIKRQENLAFAGVTEDDLAEIKQDISAFKYELLEILRFNNMKIPDYIQRSSASSSAGILSPNDVIVNPSSVSTLSIDNNSNGQFSAGTSRNFEDNALGRRHSLPLTNDSSGDSKRPTGSTSSVSSGGSVATATFNNEAGGKNEIPLTMLMLEAERRRLARRRSRKKASFRDVVVEQKMFHSDFARSAGRRNSSDKGIFTISETVDF